MGLTKVSTDGFKDDSVTTDKLANAINTERTANTAKVSLDADSVTGAKIADNAVGVEHIEDLAGDVVFKGDTSDRDMLWDASRNALVVKDNAVIELGTSTDLQIYHDGTNTYLDNNTGQFNIDSASGNAIRFLVDGSYQCQIYTSGIDLPDNKKLRLGDSEDLQIYHDGNDSYLKHSGGGNLRIETTGDANEDIYLDAYDDIYLQVADGSDAIKCIGGGAVELYHNNGLKFLTGSNGIYFPNNGTLHEKAIHFEVGSSTGDYGTLFGVTNYPDSSGYGDQNDGHWARIQSKGGCVIVLNTDGGRNDGRNSMDHFSIYHKANDSTNGKRAFSVDHTGGAQFGQAGLKIDREWDNQSSLSLQRDCNDGNDNTDGSAYLRLHGTGKTHASWTGGSDGADFSANFLIDGSTYGTSDRRAKTDIVDCPYGLDIVNKLQPRKFQLVNSALEPQGADNINLGFIAQEIKEHIPECVNYLGDEANTPNEKGWARAYALDIGEVIPVLTKAIQELSAKVAALEAA